jgi:hypothetical protein
MTGHQTNRYKRGAADNIGLDRCPLAARAARKPIVAVLAKDRIDIRWKAHRAKDIAGCNPCRVGTVRTVKKVRPSRGATPILNTTSCASHAPCMSPVAKGPAL